MIRYRDMRPDEADAVLDLVMRVFTDYVAPDFSDEGVEEFTQSARRFLSGSEDGHAITVADSDGSLVGMIDVRDTSHVCLFFVDGAVQRTGVGATLLHAAIERASAEQPPQAVTVNAGPSAVSAYERFGFVATAPESVINGIRFVPMRIELSTQVSQSPRT